MKQALVFFAFVLCLSVNVSASEKNIQGVDGLEIDIHQPSSQRVYKLYDGPDFAEEVHYIDGRAGGPSMRLLCDHNFDLNSEELKAAITNHDNSFRFYNQTWRAVELRETEGLPLNFQGMTVNLFSLPHLLPFQQAGGPYGALEVREFWAEYEGHSGSGDERRFWVRHVLSE
jgi:hypothetical protein